MIHPIAAYITCIGLSAAAEAEGAPGAWRPSSSRAYRQPGEAASLPGGPWRQTAQDVHLKGNHLCARLRRNPGGPWSSDCVAVQEGQLFENIDGRFRSQSSTRFPGGTWMLSAEQPRLEGNLFFARLRRKNLTWAEAHTVIWDGIYLWNDDGAFMLLMQACERLECVFGYVLRFNATYIYCKYLECEPIIDRDTCCEPAMPCSNISSCGYATIPDPNGYCLAATCNEDRDRQHCCIPAALCANLASCVLGYTKILGGEDAHCPRLQCDQDLDRDTCCTPAALCTNLTNSSCPHGRFLNQTWWCDGVVCEEERDKDSCCMVAEACGNHTEEFCTLGLVAKPNAMDQYCDGLICDAERDRLACCDYAEPCASLTCPYGSITLPNTFCEATHCGPRHIPQCCHPREPCTALASRGCPFGYFFNTTDFCEHLSCVEETDRQLCCQKASPCTSLVCPVSYIFKTNVLELFCEGTHCDLQRDLDRCCDAAEPCINLACPLSYTLRANASTRYCLGPACDLARDLDVCCEDAAVCAEGYACPHSYVLRNGTYCDGPTCEAARDRDNCCDPAMPCSDITCPWSHVNVPNKYCPATTCVYERDVEHCCELGLPFLSVRFTPLQLREITVDDSYRPVVQLAELTPLFHNRRTALETATASSVNGHAPALESPEKAIDNNLNTKWLDFASTPLIVRFLVPESVDTFSLTTANDMPSRDPIGWLVEASIDTVTYVKIYEIEDALDEVPLLRLAETQQFRITKPCLNPWPQGIAHGASVTCQEGELIASGSSCTAACESGFEPMPAMLNCTDGLLTPDTFLCF